ncbi:MAG TPA: hypothetical protein VHP13_01640 [Gammaproteobacteria bacterium]|jgi:plastocyanin|nr:hypothetical protein [Gammaproteobacteria bacterium]
MSLGLWLGVAAASAAADLKGSVSLGAGPVSTSDLDDTVVFYRPEAKSALKPLTGDITVTMRGKSFVPHVLTVTAGTRVRFPNGDPILHNIFSTSSGNGFDLGLYGEGESKSAVLQHPGLVRVYCNVHHEMFAYVLVLDTPYFTRPQPDGTFELKGLPPGPGEITVWNPRGELWHQHLDGPGGAPLAVQLKLSRFGVPAHFNKFGKPYDKNADPGY